MGKFQFKKKHQEEFHVPQEATQKERKMFNELQEEYDEAGFEFAEQQLDNMSAEEVRAAEEKLENEYYEHNAAIEKSKLKKGDLSKRQKSTLRDQSRKMVANRKERLGKFRNKIYNLAKTHAGNDDLGAEDDITLKAFNLPQKEKTPEEKKKWNTLKKNAPETFRRFKSMEKLKNSIQDAENDNAMAKAISKTYEIAKSEWELLKSKMERLNHVKVTLPGEDVISEKLDEAKSEINQLMMKKTFISLNRRGREISKGPIFDADLESATEKYQEELKESLKKKDINWDNLNTELSELEKKYEEAKNKCGVSKDGLDGMQQLEKARKEHHEQHTSDSYFHIEEVTNKYTWEMAKIKKDIEDVERQMFIKNEIKTKIIDVAEEPKPTYKEVENVINNYLKMMAANGEVRCRNKLESTILILQGRQLSMESEVYRGMVHTMYSPTTSLDVSGNITYAYLGGRDASEYAGYKGGDDNVSSYGFISIKLNKETVKDRVGMIIGNSKDYYEKLRGRSLDNPDILAVGENLLPVYKRAKDIAEGRAKLLSPEQEANFIATESDGGRLKYVETHVNGRIAAQDIDEVTYTYTGTLEGDLQQVKRKLLSGDLKDIKALYDQVNIINEHPEEYQRQGKPDMKLTIWDNNGRTITFDEIKIIIEGYDR